MYIKWISWALRLVATAVLLSFLCIWTTGYIVNSYMESIIKQLELPLETKPFALSGVWGTLWGSDSPAKEASEEARAKNTKATNSDIGINDPDDSDDPDEEREEAAPATSQASVASNGQASPSETTDVDVGTITEQEQQPSSGEEQPEDAVPAVSGNADAGDPQMTDAERQALYANVVSKLDASQLQLLSEALEGGVSAEKLAELKEMLKTALTEDEYAQMMETLQGTANTD
ncbi:hypothetical protein [Cohnella panacarvi]|uniref:hypothetical protein n=1 Tax=Cohnella panacarvi TaxID=400776 RepID=UPI000479B9B6|nr:hypothetical protein [Cohnella panacarvi]